MRRAILIVLALVSGCRCGADSPPRETPPDLGLCRSEIGALCLDKPCCAGLTCVGGACAVVLPP